jgi:hypothetical protein
MISEGSYRYTVRDDVMERVGPRPTKNHKKKIRTPSKNRIPRQMTHEIPMTSSKIGLQFGGVRWSLRHTKYKYNFQIKCIFEEFSRLRSNDVLQKGESFHSHLNSSTLSHLLPRGILDLLTPAGRPLCFSDSLTLTHSLLLLRGLELSALSGTVQTVL